MPRSRSAFTLIELLVVIAIIAILAVVVVLTLNPAQLLSQSRDANRVSDMNTLTNAISLASFNGLSLGTANTVYVSIPDSSSTCGGLGLPALPNGWSYACAPAATYMDTNGTGWIPVNLSGTAMGASLSKLPVDPVNKVSSCLYYTYTTNGKTFQVTTGAESQKEKATLAAASSTYSDLFSAGTNLKLEPIDYASNCSTTGSIVYTLNVGTQVVDTSSVTSTYTFGGTTGENITLAASNQSGIYWSGAGSPFYLLNPDGSTLWSGYTGTGAMLTTQTLPTTGTYTVKLTPPSGTGSATISLSNPTTGSLSLNSSTTFSTTLAGQVSNFTFSGTAGQTVTLTASDQNGVYWSGAGSPFYLLNPDGSTLWSGYTGTGAMLTTQTLPTTGTYTVRTTPPTGQGGYTGSMRFTLSQPVVGTIAFAVPAYVTTTLAGQPVYLSFAGTAGQVVAVAASNQATVYWNGSGVPFSLLNASGTSLASAWSGNNPYAITSTTLPTTGTYTILIAPPTGPGGYTGSATFTLTHS